MSKTATVRDQYLRKLKELKVEGKKVWSEQLSGETNYTHGSQPWPRTDQPFGTGISECAAFMILVHGSCPVGETFVRTIDHTRWTVVFSETEKSKYSTGELVYWIAVEADAKSVATARSRTSRDLAIEVTTANLGPDVAALLKSSEK